MTAELWHKVDEFAKEAHLSRSQVLERALFAYFGETIQERPLPGIPRPHDSAPKKAAA
jgi:predicted transcriptional regulator